VIDQHHPVCAAKEWDHFIDGADGVVLVMIQSFSLLPQDRGRIALRHLPHGNARDFLS
jgi:hypothetical protein